ncbi:hypothetical protein ABK040_013030 [Willaertia magna]
MSNYNFYQPTNNNPTINNPQQQHQSNVNNTMNPNNPMMGGGFYQPNNNMNQPYINTNVNNNPNTGYYNPQQQQDGTNQMMYNNPNTNPTSYGYNTSSPMMGGGGIITNPMMTTSSSYGHPTSTTTPSTPTTMSFYNPTQHQTSTGTPTGLSGGMGMMGMGRSITPTNKQTIGPPPTELQFDESQVHGAIGHHLYPSSTTSSSSGVGHVGLTATGTTTTGTTTGTFPPSGGLQGLQSTTIPSLSETAFEQGQNFAVQDVISHMGTLTLSNQQQQQQQPFINILPNNNVPRPKDVGELINGHVNGQPDVSPLYLAHYNAHKDKIGDRNPAEVFKTLQPDENSVKMTCNAVPQSLDLLNRYGLPFGCILKPFHSKEVPTIGGNLIIRCNNCRTYINPFVQFLEFGNKWQCNVCKQINDVPKRYYSPTDQAGVRHDFFERPELTNAIYEYLAPQEYMSRPPQPPAYLFLIDTSYNSINSGFFHSVVESIKGIIKSLKEKSSRTLVGFICFDTRIHFFNLRPTLNQPQQLVVGELNESLLPLPNDLLVNLEESYNLVEQLLDKLEIMFKQTNSIDCCLGASLNAAGRLLGRIGGKVSIFLSQLPSVGPNKLTNREDFNEYGNEKFETKVMQPADNSYRDFALLFNKDQICCDIYCYANPDSRTSYLDLASISNLSKFTGGICKLYEYPDQFSHQLLSDVKQTIIDVLTGFESVMRIRVSSGMKVTNFFGNFFIRGHDLLALPNVTGGQTYGFQLVHTGAMLSTPNVSIQVAVLYTSEQGQRKIRVCNILLPITNSLSVLYNNTQPTALVNLMGKILAADLPKEGVTNSRNTLIDKWLKTCLNGFRSVSNISSTGPGLVLPFALQHLPLYICGLSKTNLLLGGREVRVDTRIYSSLYFSSCTIQQSILMVHPILISITELINEEQSQDEHPKVLRLSPLSRKLINSEDGVYLLCDGQAIYLWLGKKQWDSDREKYYDLIYELNYNRYTLEEDEENEDDPFGDDPTLAKVYDISVLLRRQLKTEMPIRFANTNLEQPSTDKLKKVIINDFHRTLLKKLVEDKTLQVTLSYTDLITYLNK